MPFTEDLDAFMDTSNGFAITATVGGVSVKGIFNGGYQANSASAYGVESSSSSFTCKSDDLPGSTDESTTAVIALVTYYVRDIENDGSGITTLTLYQE